MKLVRRLLVGAIVVVLLFVVVAALAVRWFLGGDALATTLASQASAALGQPVTIGSAGARLYPRAHLTLERVTIGDPARLEAEEVVVSTDLRGLLARRAEDAEVQLRRGWLELPLPALGGGSSGGEEPGRAGGGGEPTTGTEAGGKPAFTIASVRSIAVEDFEVRGPSRKLRLDLAGDLTGDRLEVTRLDLASGDNRLTGTLTLDDWRRREGSFTLAAEQLDVDALVATLSDLAAGAGNGATPAATASAPKRAPKGGEADLARHLSGELRVSQGRLRGVAFRDLDTRIQIVGSRLGFDPVSVALLGGRYEGSLAVDLGERQDRVSYAGRATDIDLAQLAATAGSEGAAEGRLRASLDVEGAGKDAAAALRAARGKGEIEVGEGRIAKLDLLHAALGYLGLTDAATSPAGSFTRLGAHLALGGGELRTQDLVIEAPDFTVRGGGSVALAGTVDLTLELLLSEALSRQVKGEAARYASEGNRIVVPMLVKGSVASPKVEVDVGAAMRRAARRAEDEVKERATSEVEKRLRKLFGK